MAEKIHYPLLKRLMQPAVHVFFGYYELSRRKMIGIFGRVLSRILQTLPLKLAAETKSRFLLTTTMPYKNIIRFTVNSRRDWSRSHFSVNDPETVDWIEECAKDPGTFYDVGANVGSVSLIYASLTSSAHIYAFEPLFSTYSTLCNNIILNNFTDRISAFPTALSDKTGADHFLITTPDSGSSGHSLEDSASTRLIDSCRQKISVLTMTLDHFCLTLQFPVPDYLKIDVDGHDFEVLLGAQQLLQNGRIRGITVEKGRKYQQIRDYLLRYEFCEIPLRSNSDNLRFDRLA